MASFYYTLTLDWMRNHIKTLRQERNGIQAKEKVLIFMLCDISFCSVI